MAYSIEDGEDLEIEIVVSLLVQAGIEQEGTLEALEIEVDQGLHLIEEGQVETETVAAAVDLTDKDIKPFNLTHV